MEEYRRYFDILELPPDATLKEIRNQYTHLKSLYSENSIELIALNYDFDEEIRADYLARLDDAYEKLCGRLDNKPVVRKQELIIDAELQRVIDSIECFTGAALRSVREQAGIDLDSIHAVTKIQPEHLQEIEDELFEAFHAEVYLRSYLVEYCHFFKLDTNRVLNDYLPRYRAWAVNRQVRGMGEAIDWLTKMK